MTPDEFKGYDALAQRTHYLGAALAVLVAHVAFHAAGWGLLIVAFAFWKEKFWDPKHETVEVQGSGGRDFWNYVLGAAGAYAFLGVVQWLS